MISPKNRWYFFLLPAIVCLDLPLRGVGVTGIVRGTIVESHDKPVAGAVITLIGPGRFTLRSDDNGAFVQTGIAPGDYKIIAAAPGYLGRSLDHIRVEPSSRLRIKLILAAASSPLDEGGAVVIDESSLATRTTISAAQIERLPSAHSVWSLIENQDFSATTNRIDVGGLWETKPALFSARGATSWTQNAYILNGLDVSDPYWTGVPLLMPDVFSLEGTQLDNASLPIQAFSPGAYFTLVPKDGTPEFHGGMSGYYSDKRLTTSNITPAIRDEGLLQSHTLNKLTEFNLHFSGPLAGPKVTFFAGLTSQSVGRNIADYDREDPSLLLSGLFHLRFGGRRSSVRFLWTGQNVADASRGAGRGVPFLSTIRQNSLYNILQLIWEATPGENHRVQAGLGFSQANLSAEFQKGAVGPQRVDLFRIVPAEPIPTAGEDRRSRLGAYFEGQSVFPHVLGADHLLEYGVRADLSTSTSHQDFRNGLLLYTYNGRPLHVAVIDAPRAHGETSAAVNLFAGETLTFVNHLSVSLGANVGWTRGWNPRAHIEWLNVSPRFALSLPLSRKRTSFLRLSAARYYFTLPLSDLAYGNPDAPGRQVYGWSDENSDDALQDGEQGPLLRREGALYGAIDPKIKRPYTDELGLAWIQDLGRGWFFTLAGFLRETRDLVATLNTGVQTSDYDPVPFYDEGDDRIPGTHDDLRFTVFNQRPETLGLDFFLLTNPGSRISRYQGLDLTLVKRFSPKFLFYLALTATHAVATTNPGNTEWENDEGVVGPLYDSPNMAINARGRPRFDRAYTGRIGVSLETFLGIRWGAVVKYYDGQPFTRKIIVPDLNQGPFYVQAHPRGVARYEYNMTVDVRLEKAFVWKNASIRFILDGFNIFNRNLATAENEWTGPDFPLRFATEIQSPRVFRVGLNFEF